METKKKDDRKLLGSQIEDRILEYIKEKPLEVGDRSLNLRRCLRWDEARSARR